MESWQYKRVFSHELYPHNALGRSLDPIPTMDVLGLKGWELAGVSGDVFYFKRPLEPLTPPKNAG